jgi:hypothetical protein
VQVRDRLVAACQKLGVQFVYNASAEQITPPPSYAQPHDTNNSSGSSVSGGGGGDSSLTKRQHSSKEGSPTGPWRVGLAAGVTVTGDRLLVSTGGYSFPAVGTDGTGLRLLTGLGHKLSDGGCYAALTPLRGPHPGGEQLAGGWTGRGGTLAQGFRV